MRLVGETHPFLPMRFIAKFLLCGLGALLPFSVGAEVPSFEFSASTYKLLLMHAGRGEKDSAMNVYTLDGAGPKDAMSSMEVAFWPKVKNLKTSRDNWLLSITPRLTEKVETIPTPGNPNQVIVQAVVFTSNPAGEEVMLHRFDHNPKDRTLVTYLMRWRFLEEDGTIDDRWFRQNRDRLVEELRQLELPIVRQRPEGLQPLPPPPQS